MAISAVLARFVYYVDLVRIAVPHHRAQIWEHSDKRLIIAHVSVGNVLDKATNSPGWQR